MKSKVLLVCLLGACAPAPIHFNISADAPQADVELFTNALADVNGHLGCNFLSYTESTIVYTPEDVNMNLNYVAFTNNVKVLDDVGAGGEKFNHGLLGLTYVTTGPEEEADIELMDFSQMKNVSYNDSYNFATHIILHELGHAMWLNHTKNPNDIMYPYTNNDNPTTDDMWARYLEQLTKAGVSCESISK